MSLKGKVETLLEYEIRDKEGRIIKKGKIKAKSWVTNFARLNFILLTGGSDNLVNTGGSTVGITVSDLANCSCLAPEGDDSYGVKVGTGTSEALPGNYNLESPIAHGSADGQLYHYATEGVAVEVDVGTKTTTFKLTRDFKNNGSVDVNIQEVGLICKIGANYFLLFRHVLASAVTVPAGATITWRIVFKIVT